MQPTGTQKSEYPQQAMKAAKAKLKTASTASDLIEGLLPQGTYGVLYGDRGVGKSYLAFQMMIAISSGAPLFGRPVRKGRCFFYQAADDKQELALRGNAICAGLSSQQRLDQEGSLAYAVPEPMNRILFTNDASGDVVPTETFKRFRHGCLNFEDLDLIVVDCATTSMLVDLNDSKVASTIQAYFEEIIEKTGATVLLLAHPQDGNCLPSQALMNTVDWSGSMALFDGHSDIVSLEIRDDKHDRDSVVALIRGAEGVLSTPKH